MQRGVPEGATVPGIQLGGIQGVSFLKKCVSKCLKIRIKRLKFDRQRVMAPGIQDKGVIQKEVP